MEILFFLFVSFMSQRLKFYTVDRVQHVKLSLPQKVFPLGIPFTMALLQ